MFNYIHGLRLFRDWRRGTFTHRREKRTQAAAPNHPAPISKL